MSGSVIKKAHIRTVNNNLSWAAFEPSFVEKMYGMLVCDVNNLEAGAGRTTHIKHLLLAFFIVVASSQISPLFKFAAKIAVFLCNGTMLSRFFGQGNSF